MRFKVLIVCVAALVAFAGCGSRGGADFRDFSHIEPLLREGDLVFRRGQGLTSRAVLMADTGGIYSHAGIVVREGTEEGTGSGGAGGWKIVHIVPGERDADGTKDRIKTEPPEIFFAPGRAQRGAVIRVEVPDEVAVRVARQAKRLAAMPLMFDHDYDLNDTTRMYCTELVHNAFLREGIDLTEGRRTKIDLPAFGGDYILPGDLLHSRYVRVIYDFDTNPIKTKCL